VGGAIGQAFYGFFQYSAFLVVGWTFTGLMIGAAPGMYDLLERLLRKENRAGAVRKLIHGLIGGFVGGFLGGLIFLALQYLGALVFREVVTDPWTPVAAGFIALGLCIGLLIGTAQVVLKEAWLKIESGRRAGRELILSKPAITIGRAESCDIGLFGDPTVERTHARILLQNNRYLVADENTPGGTYLNGQRIGEPAPLRSGDVIRVGNCTLRFGERQKRPA
jgi:MFS family permease